MQDKILIRGAREHNLKNINVEIPRNKLVVITGLSGSGKSSLAFDTIYAEGQRRYVESLSAYARQFLGLMQKPDVDYIEGLSPAISIDQKTTSKNPRSTVGTVTEIYDYFRLLFARIGIPHCPKCGKEIKQQTIDQMVDAVMSHETGTRLLILAPVIRGKKGEHVKVFEDARKNGYIRAIVDDNMVELEDEISLEKNKKHNIELVIDRVIVKEENRGRIADSLEMALKLAKGIAEVSVVGGEKTTFSQNYSCPDCGISLEEISPRMFSFNNPYGACPVCSGLGSFMRVDSDLVIVDKNLSLAAGAIRAPGWNFEANDTIARAFLISLAREYNFDMNTPYKDLPEEIQNIVLYGNGNKRIKVNYDRWYGSSEFEAAYEGVIPTLERRYKESQSDASKNDIEDYMMVQECKECKGKRLKKESLAVTVGGKSIDQVCDMPIAECKKFFDSLELNETQTKIAAQVLKEINTRLGFLIDVGLNYLTLSRSSGTLSGGEAQRIRLATQIGSGLTGVLYILDEPSIGLHQRDNDRLIGALKKLRDLDNTVIVVEHDEDTMYAADYIVDIGPGAGVNGGNVIAVGDVEQIKKSENSQTGLYLSGKKSIEVPEVRRSGNGNFISVKGAKENNLKNVKISIPLGAFTCVTGVSGSGKSTLINEILYKALIKKINKSRVKPGKYDEITGIENIDKIINIDQSPIGRTPRSNPATYTGVFDIIRELFASTNDAKARGYAAGRFSFNVKGGRCEACSGDGIIKIEMHFLPDVYVTCEACKGKRYNRETLEVKYKGKSIYDILNMTVDEAVEFFVNMPRIKRKIETLKDVGLGYIKLGQSSTTLSGGEAQRIKLAAELSKRSTGKTMYILDEPTTGLHMADVDKLVDIIQRLTDAGNTVLVIEHNLDVIKTADYLIDLGPEGGDKGGKVIFSGTPEEIVKCSKSYTGKFLKKYLSKK